MTKKSPDRLDKELTYSLSGFMDEGLLNDVELSLIQNFLEKFYDALDLFKISEIDAGLSSARSF